jgi:acetyltransferase-like isoleucine patch superfamily enzyme
VKLRGPTNRFRREGNVDVHPDAEIWVHVEGVSLETRGKGRIIVGKGAFLNGGVWIRAAELVHVGDWCKVGPRVIIMDSDAHELSRGHATPGKTAPVVLESDVLVGAGSIILKGVKIGKHSVVGAGSVVTRNVPASVLVAGNPARIVREI